MEKLKANHKSCLQPMPKVIVTVRDKEGKDNGLVVGYCGNCSFDPPMVMIGIVPSRYSYHMIKENGSFVINIPTTDNKAMYEVFGKISARDMDKMAKYDTKDADCVNASILTDCPINIECSVVDSIMTGSHEMFVGEVKAVHGDKNIIDENGNLDYSKVDYIK